MCRTWKHDQSDDQEKIVDLWNDYLYLDREFNEYFSEDLFIL